MSRVLRKRRLPEKEETNSKSSPLSNSAQDKSKPSKNPSPTIKGGKKVLPVRNKANPKAENNDKPKKTENKFFKSKEPSSDIALPIRLMKRAGMKNKKVLEKKQESLGYATPMRQITLSESFGRGSLRARLRPRKNAKDYKDYSTDSLLLEKSISPDKRKTFVLLEKMDKEIKPGKQPIYKAAKLRDKSNEDKDSIYDFQFDDKDPDEKPARNKRRKKATRKPAISRKKKTNVLGKNNNNEAPKKTIEASKKDLVGPEEKKLAINAEKHEPLDKEVKKTKETEFKKVTDLENLSPASNSGEKSPRVRICNIETLSGDRKVNFAPNPFLPCTSSAKFNPFRSTQSIFNPRSTIVMKDMMDHSLLNKSLSPIKGRVETFNPASPWRPPLPVSFSSVKQVVQSTPQIKRNFGRITQGLRIDERDENDENEGGKAGSVEKAIGKRAPIPLGVRISNAENIQTSKIGRERKPLGIALNYVENNVNSGYADRLYKSPKKNDKPVTGGLGSPSFKKKTNNRVGDAAESLMPPKRDSGIEDAENSPPLGEEEQKLMRQSNLNTFLNLDEMPESIRINTSHGIFGDGHSSPAVKNPTPRVQMQDSIANCFGFDEDNSDAGISPLRLDQKPTTPTKNMLQHLKGRALAKKKVGAARISLGEIKNTLYPRKEKIFEKAERGGDIKKMNREEPKKDNRGTKISKKTKIVLDPVQFSDTFDVLSESGNGEEKDKSLGTEIALFADLEPVHFTKPPRWSYTKKRDRKQYWSSDEEDDDNVVDQEAPVLKKRKLVKMNKIEEKKIDEWVKSVNETFQEIDDFDLVVEKLS